MCVWEQFCVALRERESGAGVAVAVDRERFDDRAMLWPVSRRLGSSLDCRLTCKEERMKLTEQVGMCKPGQRSIKKKYAQGKCTFPQTNLRLHSLGWCV